MATLDIETSYSAYKNCMLRLGRYMSDGSLAVEIYNMQDGEIARVTVCLRDTTLGENESYVDTKIARGLQVFWNLMVWQKEQGKQEEAVIVFIQQWNLIEKR